MASCMTWRRCTEVIKLLIVDDSALMRRHLGQIFEAQGGFTLRQARNGREAVALNREFEPDVITLDINMPELDGLSALALIMAERPVPVVMVSSLTERGALATFEALNLGAIDYVAKPGGTISLSMGAIARELVDKVTAAARARLRSRAARPAPTPVPAAPPVRCAASSGPPGLVVVGVSTGGPGTLQDILPNLPAQFPWPVLVAQHMPAAFTRSFAERLDKECPLRVVEVASPLMLEPGTIYIAKGGADMLVAPRGERLAVLPKPEAAGVRWHPSVELLGRSVLEHCDPARVIAVMLTGMGHDGAYAFADIKSRGGRTIAEDESSCVVYGMPRELIERGGASVILPSDKIAAQLNAWVDA
jgi:two-component system chemotaxis response regulator CheB